MPKPNIEFLDHLQFVHPSRIETKLNELSMEWENLFLKKLSNIMDGNNASVKQYIKLSKILFYLKKIIFDKTRFKTLRFYLRTPPDAGISPLFFSKLRCSTGLELN